MGLLFAALAGISGSIFSYAMRKSLDGGGSSRSFTFVQLLISFVMALFLGPIRNQHYEWNGLMALTGFLIGIFYAGILASLGKALERGPAGLMFAIVNSACVMPALLLTALFGPDFGFTYTFIHAIGSFLVIFGLVWSAKKSLSQVVTGTAWIPYSLIAFILQALFLTALQWRSIHIMPGHQEHAFLLPLTEGDAATEWFLPMVFLGAALMTGMGYKKPSAAEMKCGFFGGLFNGCSLFCITLATEFATPFEKTLLFPASAVTVILLCTAWGQALYKEEPNWRARVVSAVGVVLPTFFV